MPEEITRAISVRQPYAEQIISGKKKKEYRSRPTKIRGRVYVYASLRPGDWDDWYRMRKQPGDLRTGVIIGSVEIVDCDWDGKVGCYAYKLSNPKRAHTYRKPLNHPGQCFWLPQFEA
jgi:hypothetical protein